MSFYYRFGVMDKMVFRVLEVWVRFFGVEKFSVCV
jgi:hypothetical protein